MSLYSRLFENDEEIRKLERAHQAEPTQSNWNRLYTAKSRAGQGQQYTPKLINVAKSLHPSQVKAARPDLPLETNYLTSTPNKKIPLVARGASLERKAPNFLLQTQSSPKEQRHDNLYLRSRLNTQLLRNRSQFQSSDNNFVKDTNSTAFKNAMDERARLKAASKKLKQKPVAESDEKDS